MTAEENTEDAIKNLILEALAHPEAEEGLYFRNFRNLHEEDARPIVEGTQEDVLECLRQLVEEGKVRMDDQTEEPIFHLIK
jgi:hypothetical protein